MASFALETRPRTATRRTREGGPHQHIEVVTKTAELKIHSLLKGGNYAKISAKWGITHAATGGRACERVSKTVRNGAEMIMTLGSLGMRHIIWQIAGQFSAPFW